VEHQADAYISGAVRLGSTQPDGLYSTLQIRRMSSSSQIQPVGRAAGHLYRSGSTCGDPHWHWTRVVEVCWPGRAHFNGIAGEQCARSHHRRFEFGNGGWSLAEKPDSGVTNAEHKSGTSRRDAVDGTDRVGQNRRIAQNRVVDEWGETDVRRSLAGKR